MCGCPVHVAQTVSQLAANVQNFGPLAGVASAALMGGKFGGFLLRLRAKASKSR